MGVNSLSFVSTYLGAMSVLVETVDEEVPTIIMVAQFIGELNQVRKGKRNLRSRVGSLGEGLSSCTVAGSQSILLTRQSTNN